MRKKLLVGAALALVLAALGAVTYFQLVKAGVLRYNRYDRREKGSLAVGGTAPDLTLTLYDGSPVRLSQLWETRPVFLVFGSCTWPPFRRKIGDLHRIYDAYKDRAHFLTVYISEAHPDDEWQMDVNRKEKFVFNQPKTFEERKGLVAILVERLHYRLPVAIDSLDNRAEEAFAAWPERIYLLGNGGRILYKGEMGPFGFHPEEAGEALASVLPAPPPAAPRAGT